jgi:CheY-like chemotaxis protein
MARVLVIDDIAGVRRSIAGVLSRSGHEVEVAENGERGVEMARRSRPDLVLVDMLMPEKDGVETLEQIRAEGLAGASIAMSGGGSLVASEDALAIGRQHADAAMTKPFENDDLLALVDRLTGDSP